MLKKLSGWYRLFIIFAVMWTVLSIWGASALFYHDYVPYPKDIMTMSVEEYCEWNTSLLGLTTLQKLDLSLGDLNEDIHDLVKERIKEGLKDHKFLQKAQLGLKEAQERELSDYHQFHKYIKRGILIFPLCWLVPIGLVYGIGWCVGWVTRGFRKD